MYRNKSIDPSTWHGKPVVILFNRVFCIVLFFLRFLFYWSHFFLNCSSSLTGYCYLHFLLLHKLAAHFIFTKLTDVIFHSYVLISFCEFGALSASVTVFINFKRCSDRIILKIFLLILFFRPVSVVAPSKSVLCSVLRCTWSTSTLIIPSDPESETSLYIDHAC